MLEKPYDADISFNARRGSFSGRGKISSASDIIVSISLKGDYQMQGRSLVSLSSSLDVKTNKSGMKHFSISAKKSSSNTYELEIKKENNILLQIIVQSSGSSYSMLIEQPSKQTEIKFVISNSALTLSLYPNKKANGEKYEIDASYRKNSRGFPVRGELKAKVPQAKDMIISWDIITSESDIRANAIIDVFSTPEKSIVTRLTAKMMNPNEYVVDLNLSGAVSINLFEVIFKDVYVLIYLKLHMRPNFEALFFKIQFNTINIMPHIK